MRISDWSSDVCSSDLCCGVVPSRQRARHEPIPGDRHGSFHSTALFRADHSGRAGLDWAVPGRRRKHARSEEHTSELQSLMRISYAVFCLKKKKNTRISDLKTLLSHLTKKTTSPTTELMYYKHQQYK